jgi:putative transposase
MVSISSQNVQCKVCGSYRTVRYGKIHGIQKWKCKDCGTQLIENHAQYGMKTPYVQISQAIKMYYQGISLNAIREQLQQQFNYSPSVSTVYNWVVKYSHKAQKIRVDYHPEVGDVWLADETSLNISGAQIWIWDIKDIKTHFLLASRVLVWRNTYEAYSLFEQATNKALKIPKVVITARITNYLREMNGPFRVENSAGELEKFHNTLQQRNDMMGDLKRIDKVIEFTNGWMVHYNYYRPQDSLAGKTPSEIANCIVPTPGLIPS